MKLTKKWVALLICFAMLAVLCVSVSAAGGKTNLSAELSAETAEIGDQITLTISNGDMNVRSIKAGFYFDNTKLQVNKITWSSIVAYSEEDDDDIDNGASSKTTKKKANEDGSALGVYAINNGADSDCYEGVIVTVIFDVIAEGDATITLREESVGTDAFKSDSAGTLTVTIGSTAPSCDHLNKTYTYETNSNGTHKVKCECGEYVSENEACNGTATCAAKAYCTKCETSYGELGGHTYGQLIAATEAVHTQTELKGAVAAHYFCDVCDTYFDKDQAATTLKELTGDAPEHAHDHYDTTANQHQSICSCGKPIGEAAGCEISKETKKCTVCYADCSHVNFANSSVKYVDNRDGTHVYKVFCNDCNDWGIKDAAQPCVDTDSNGYCDLCHLHAGWSDNGNGTCSQVCACGLNNGPSNHAFVFGTCSRCGATEHVCSANLTAHAATESTCNVAGNSAYWSCTCGKFYSDENAANEIAENSWILALDPNNHKNTSVAAGFHPTGNNTHYQWIACDDCDNKQIKKTEAVACTDKANDSDHTCDYCDNTAALTECSGGTATCTEKATCTECGQSYGEKNLTNHVGHDHYEVTATTHRSICSCGEAIGEAVAHDYTYDAAKHKCICGDVEMFVITMDATGGKFWNGAPVYAVKAEYGVEFNAVPADPTKEGYKFVSWNTKADGTGDDIDLTPGTYTFTADLTVYAQWEVAIHSGWNEIDGEWYYYLDEQTKATGLTRVPYPTVAIDGVTYAPDAEDLAYYNANKDTSKYSDATTAVFVFDQDGKFQQTTGIVNGKHFAVNGCVAWHVGFVEIDGAYYYFAGDTSEKMNGNVMVTGKVYATRDYNTDKSVGSGVIYMFDEENGKLIENKGIVDGYYYDDDNTLAIGAGLVEYGDGYIYVRSNGQVVKNAKYWLTASKLTAAGITDYKPGMYSFDENGMLVLPEIEPELNGIVEKDGKYYYYVDGVKQAGAGVVKMSDENGTFYIYVTADGTLATGIYWPTNLNGLLERGSYDWGTDGKYYPKAN